MTDWDWLDDPERNSPNPGIPDTSPSSPERPQWLRDGMSATELGGPDRLEIAGDQDILWSIVGGRREYKIRFDVHVVLVAEDGDTDVAVWLNGRRVGYLARGDASRLRPGLIQLQREHTSAIALPGLITGGGTGGQELDLVLDYDATAFR